MNEWISVEDRDSLPEEWEQCAVMSDNGVDYAVYSPIYYPVNSFILLETYQSDFGPDVLYNVTHWMPKPEPPETTVAKAQGE